MHHKSENISFCSHCIHRKVTPPLPKLSIRLLNFDVLEIAAADLHKYQLRLLYHS